MNKTFFNVFLIAFFILVVPGFTLAATLGNTLQGVSSIADSHTIGATRFTMPSENGDITSVSVYFNSSAVSPNNQFQLMIYADNAGVPGILLYTSATGTIVPNSWNTLSLSGALSANTTYWLAVNTNGDSSIAYTNVANSAYYHAQNFSAIPNPFGAGSTGDNKFFKVLVRC